MKTTAIMALTTLTLFILAGCGGNSSGSSDSNLQVTTSSQEKFQTVICTEDDSSASECTQADDAFDLAKHNVLVLTAPKVIESSEYFYYKGNRFGIVPKEEKSLTAFNMLAYGLFLYAKGGPYAGRSDFGEILSYHDAKEFLKKEFKLTGTKKQNEVILAILNHNLEELGKQNLELKTAYIADIKAMAESLINLTVKGKSLDLSGWEVFKQDGRVVGYIDNQNILPQPMLFSSIDKKKETLSNTSLILNQHSAAYIASIIREEEEKPTEVDKVFAKLECKENENKQIFMYGINDNFNPSNPEPTHPSTTFSALFPSSYSAFMHGYDHSVPNINQPSIFIETLNGLPTNLTQGLFAISLKEKGYSFNDTSIFYIDKYSVGSNYGAGTDNAEGNISTIRNTWANPITNVYYQNMSQMTTASGQNLLSKLQSGQTSLDTTIMFTTNVNYIAIATCIPKEKPEETPVTKIPTKLKCNPKKGEQLHTIWGGVADDFAPGTDGVTPSNNLSNTFSSMTTIKYDEIIKKKGRLLDTLNNPNIHISQMEVLVNTRPRNLGAANDHIVIGTIPNLTTRKILMYSLLNAVGTSTLNGGTAHNFYGTDSIFDANGTNVGNLLSLVNTNVTDLDIIVGDKTEVDTVRWSMCVIKDYQEPCPDADGDGICDKDDCAPKDPDMWNDSDGDGVCDEKDCAPANPDMWEDCYTPCGEQITLDLRSASSWKNESGTNPTVQQAGGTSWDNKMNWFSFGNTPNAEHKLNIDFCACGSTDITIDEMRSDNRGKIYIDTDPTPSTYVDSSYIVYRDDISQNAMSASGTHVQGTQHISNPTGNGITHTLHFDIKNAAGPTGGSVNGTLNFMGHLGKCTTPNPDTPLNDYNLTVLHEKIPLDIIDIVIEPQPTDDGNYTGGVGSVVLTVAGPLVQTNPAGQPYIVKEPKPIVIPFGGDDAKPIKREDIPTTNLSPTSIYVGCHNGHVAIFNETENGTVYITETSWDCEGTGTSIENPVTS